MTQFHEGQEVEVWGANMYPWRKAKIVAAEIHRGALRVPTGAYIVEYHDGTRGVFDAAQIRAVTPECVARGTIEDRGLVTTIRIFDVPEDIGS